MAKIIAIKIAYENVFIQDNNNFIWVLGPNEYNRLGIDIKDDSNETTLYNLTKTGLKLDKNDLIDDGYCNDHVTFIITKNKSLYCSIIDFKKIDKPTIYEKDLNTENV